MSMYGEWKPATIAANEAKSSAIDLGREYDFLMLQIPGMTKCKLSLQVAERLGGTYYELGNEVTTEEETFNRAASWTLGGFRFVKVVASSSQLAQRLIRIKGMRY